MDVEIPPEIEAKIMANMGYLYGIRAVAGYQKPDSHRTGFLAFQKFMTEPEPAFVAHWRSNAKSEKFLNRLSDGVIHSAYQAYLAVNYHYDRVVELETAMMAVFASDFAFLEGMSMGTGGTDKLDFEYQAFVLSYRRCLDYFTYGLNAYFKDSANSFRDWEKHLPRHKPALVADALLHVYRQYRPDFKFVMKTDDSVSVRDKISHYEAVGAGTVNVSTRGVTISGGGEDLLFSEMTLSEVLKLKIDKLKAYLNESLFAWLAAVDPNDPR